MSASNPFLNGGGKPATDDGEIARELGYGPYAGMGFNPFSVPGIAVMSPAAAGILSMGDTMVFRPT
ncbi:MAG TPA: hypothetical protein VMV92_28625 [Streptosporangiaceae bacterium]|nr:hypothetical protein [Streptosporangiaceae bacterium]HVB46109.1 hypothetical protein [Streptosporangiaceae bacterium]